MVSSTHITIDHERVCAVIRETAAAEIMPLWQNLCAHQVEFKQLDDAVTVADQASEQRLARELAALLPGSLVIGEESVHANPILMTALDSVRPVWVIDPLDGTNNFAAGEGPFAVMVCLVYHGETLAAWIFDPLEQTMLQAERGAGATLNGERLTISPFSGDTSSIAGALSTKYLPETLRPAALKGATQLGPTRASGCAGYDYRALARGDYQFAFYYRTLVWDHAPGVLITTEAGAIGRCYNGSPYAPRADATGLLCASDEHTWETVHELLVPDTIT
jgi:fructose-1,6-bisphosphatase/inositol monophosphatase family enzyme